MARKIKICTEDGCHNAQTSKEYCRLHYLKNWKTIKAEEEKKAAKRLNRYVEGIMKRNPDVAEQGKGAAKETGSYNQSASEAVERLVEDLGYSDPDSLDEIISNLKVDR